LAPLTLGPRFNYHVKDSMDSAERNYTYVFNVCDNVGHVPRDTCAGVEAAPAYQVSDTQDFCYKLGNSPTDVDWSLIDADNPTTGVRLTYRGGDQCDGTNYDRTLTVNFLCSTEQGMSEFSHTRVIEDNCQYKLDVNTVFGCPNECYVGSNRQLCSGHGFCGMDDDHNKPRCFCYDTFYGFSCENQVEDGGLGVVGVLLILMILGLSGLLAAAVWVYFKVRKLRRRKLYQMGDVGDDDGSTGVFAIDDTSDL